MSPFEKLFYKLPNLQKFKAFSCLCYPWLRPYASHKLTSRSKPYIFIGYSLEHNIFRCYEPNLKKSLYHITLFYGVYISFLKPSYCIGYPDKYISLEYLSDLATQTSHDTIQSLPLGSTHYYNSSLIAPHSLHYFFTPFFKFPLLMK